MYRFIKSLSNSVKILLFLGAVWWLQYIGWRGLLHNQVVSEGVSTDFIFAMGERNSAKTVGLEISLNGTKKVITDPDVILSYLRNPGPMEYEVRGSGKLIFHPRPELLDKK